MDKTKQDALMKFIKRNTALFVLLLAGVAMLLLPGKSESQSREALVSDDELRLGQILSKMEGVGEVSVLLAEMPGREEGYLGAVVVCKGAADPAVQLRILDTVNAYTGLTSNRIVVQKMIS